LKREFGVVAPEKMQAAELRSHSSEIGVRLVAQQNR